MPDVGWRCWARRVLAAVYQLPDGVYGTVSGILRGLGRQPQLLWVNLTGFWAVGMVTAVALTFPLGLGELGLWWGVLSGITATGAPPEKTLSFQGNSWDWRACPDASQKPGCGGGNCGFGQV